MVECRIFVYDETVTELENPIEVRFCGNGNRASFSLKSNLGPLGPVSVLINIRSHQNAASFD